MTYKLTTKGNKVEISLNKTEVVTKVVRPEYSVSLARTGGQGSKGDTIQDVYIAENGDLVVELLTSSGQVTTIIAGNIKESLALNDLLDVEIVEVEEGDYLVYDASTSKYRNHKLTTSKVTDIDNTAKTDGALLIYNGSTGKYTATNQLNNPNTLIVGGNF
jgi:intein/homing endonuclease